MYAIITSGGSQYKVAEGDVLQVASLPAEVGSSVELDQVLLLQNEGDISVGAPYVEGAKVTATVESHGRDKKVIVYKHKKNYKRKQGHRQGYTRLRIEKIES